MPIICLVTQMRAPIDRCFDLARSIEIHLRSTEKTHEKVVGGTTNGLIGFNDEVTWEATHLCIRQRLTSRITVWNPPYHFRDSMVRGAFHGFDHDHFLSMIRALPLWKIVLNMSRRLASWVGWQISFFSNATWSVFCEHVPT